MGEFLLGVDIVAHVAELLLHDPEDGERANDDSFMILKTVIMMVETLFHDLEERDCYRGGDKSDDDSRDFDSKVNL